MKNADKPDAAALAALLDPAATSPAAAWAHHGTGDVAQLPDPLLAILAAEKLGNTRALQAVSAPKDLRKAAAGALHRLRSRGVKVEETVAPRAFTLAAAEVELPCRAFLSLPEREGEVQILLTASDREGSCVLACLIGGQDLVLECQHAHVNRSALRDTWEEARRFGHVEVPFVTGLHYAERFLAREHAYKHFLEHVPGPTLTSARVLDPLAGAPGPSDAEPATPNWMLPSGLLDLLSLEGAAGRLLEEMATGGVLDHGEQSTRIEAAMLEAADKALDPAARARVDSYLELVIAGATWRGWPRHVDQLVRIRTAVAEGQPGRDVAAVYNAVRAYVALRTLRMAEEAQAGAYDDEGLPEEDGGEGGEAPPEAGDDPRRAE